MIGVSCQVNPVKSVEDYDSDAAAEVAAGPLNMALFRAFFSVAVGGFASLPFLRTRLFWPTISSWCLSSSNNPKDFMGCPPFICSW